MWVRRKEYEALENRVREVEVRTRPVYVNPDYKQPMITDGWIVAQRLWPLPDVVRALVCAAGLVSTDNPATLLSVQSKRNKVEER